MVEQVRAEPCWNNLPGVLVTHQGAKVFHKAVPGACDGLHDFLIEKHLLTFFHGMHSTHEANQVFHNHHLVFFDALIHSAGGN